MFRFVSISRDIFKGMLPLYSTYTHMVGSDINLNYFVWIEVSKGTDFEWAV